MMQLSDLRRKVFLFCLFLGLTFSAGAQNVTIKGTVVDKSGEPVIGAGVVESANHSNGTVTDFDGAFQLTLPGGASVEVSSIGYVTQTLKAIDGMHIILEEDNELLDEVLVVGYGVQKKSDVTGAIAKVDKGDMANRTITSAQDAIGGKTSGVQMISTSGEPGAAATIRVRGYSSNYSSDPLYIVDGLKQSNISNIDANDIESIEVLKDAAAAAIYGAEAGNGVILVTTKKAAKGDAKITYDFQISSTSMAHMPKVMNASEYIQYYKEAGTYSDDYFQTYYDGVTDNDWAKSATENSIMSKHTLSFQQAGENGNIFMSLNYLDHDGFLKGNVDTHNRANFTINAELKIKKWLTIGTNTRFSYAKMNTRPVVMGDGYAGGPFTSLIELDPLTPVKYDMNNLPFYIQALLDNGQNPLTDDDGTIFGVSQFVLSQTTFNPLAYQKQTSYLNKSIALNSSFYANLMPVKGLVITSRFGTNVHTNYSNTYAHTYYHNTKQYNYYPSVSTSSPLSLYYQWENFANYSTSFGNHNVSAMAGMSFSKNNTNTLSGSANKVSRELPNYGYLDFIATDASMELGGQSIITSKLSYFGRLDWSYKDKYMAEVTMRADANDLSVLSLEQRWGFFPAVSGGWVFTKEDFFPKNNILTYGKLRASWGQNGSISNLGNYVYTASIATDEVYSFDGTTNYSTAAVPNALGNDHLKWETSEQLDFGLDLRFFQDKLTLTADYYVKDTKDLLISGATPSLTAGNNPSPINAGNVRNQGLDLDLAYKGRIGDFNYGVSANMATLKNRVTYLNPTITRLAGSNAIGRTTFTYFEEGYPIWYMRGYRLDHIDQATGDPVLKDLSGDGLISGADVEMIGSAIPDVTYGITLTASWKNFDFLLFGSGSHGGEIFNNLNSIDDQGVNKLRIYYTDRWTASNTTASRPRPACNYEKEYYLSDANVFDGSYFKIKQIQLGYTIPSKISKKFFIDHCRAYVSLDDFFTFTKYPGLDPETASHNSTSAIGIDSGNYPSSKKVVFGINVSF